MKKIFLVLLCLSVLGLYDSYSQCDDYPFVLNISGFSCGSGEGTICFETDADLWGPCYDEFSDYAVQISYPEPNFIYTDLHPSSSYPFIDISDPISQPGITTIQFYYPNPPVDIIVSGCFDGVLQIPNTVFTLNLVNVNDPNDIIGTTTFTLDDAVSIGIPNQITNLSDWISPNGPLLPAAQAAVQGQSVVFNGPINVNVNYEFGSTYGSQYNELIMMPGTRIEIP